MLSFFYKDSISQFPGMGNLSRDLSAATAE
jgi:hypothetical protein